MSERLASVSLDLDNLWSYMKTHGDAGWESRPTYLDTVVPAALEAFGELGLRVTFFVVGVDAADARNRDALATIPEAGHEVGNHSFEHEPWLHLYSREQVQDEIVRAEDAIADATGQRPVGFRGPGYSWSIDLLEILHERGYLYDASTLPTYLGPLARMYYFWKADLTREERRQRRGLFGAFSDGLRPVKPYRWRLPGERALLEIPVTTIPVVKTPFHFSYLLYLSRFSKALMWTYLRTALAACRTTGTEPSFLLHPLDLLGGDQLPQLAFFPGMDLPGRHKVELFKKVLGVIGARYRIVNMSTHARALSARPGLPLRTPRPATVEPGAAPPPPSATESR